ncbi:DNA cytosine methyltransferase [Candidatus Dojkabacteria bacterium]|jgi:DNA (cytosine-5)-methyltransferase 3A|nr:DNA cytosine methyltransferase [Candidatus Dojkabacteria bacterium]
MIVLSLFDGISCGRLALERANIKINKYFSSEIDKYAIDISKKNYPDIIQLGDINDWKNWNINWSEIDLLIGGSPCQGFTFSGNRLNFMILEVNCFLYMLIFLIT